ncbi:ribosome biogenesis protein SLX9-domain-containing protein [Usnea florida]
MAPRPPTKPSIKTPTPTHLSTSHHNHPKAPLKRSKRHSKHALLLSRIQNTAPQKQPSSRITKRRRPHKKLITTLDSLADALPNPTDDGEEWEGIDGAEGKGRDGAKKMKHKSLRSRPGAGKKKEALVAMERERFAKNLAEMCAGSSSASQDAVASGEGEGVVVGGVGAERGSADRWAAIRGFISQTMERRPEGKDMVGKK